MRVPEMEPTSTAGREQAIDLSVHHKSHEYQCKQQRSLATTSLGLGKSAARWPERKCNATGLRHSCLEGEDSLPSSALRTFITMSRMMTSQLPHKRWSERIQCADGSLFGRCAMHTYMSIARQSRDVNRCVQEEKNSATIKILNALKYAAPHQLIRVKKYALVSISL
jgi:hypothetical protein